MLVLSFCFNTLVVTYFNIYRAIRAALLDLSGTAVGFTPLTRLIELPYFLPRIRRDAGIFVNVH